MRLTYRQRPSAGAGFVVLVAVLVAAFLCVAWALRTPALERVWRIDAELALGQRPSLSRREFRLFQKTLARYPRIGASLIEDRPHGIFSANEEGRVDGAYAYLVRLTPESPGEIELTYAGARRAGSVSARLRTSTARHRGLTRQGTPLVWRLPDDGPFPQLIEVRLEPSTDAANGAAHLQPVQIRLRSAP